MSDEQFAPCAQVIASLAREAERKGHPSAIVPEELYVWVGGGGEVNVLDLEKHRNAPKRKRGAVTFHTAESFIAYVAVHAGADGATTLWGDVEQSRVTAVLDDHTREDARWGDHEASLRLRHPPSWKAWIGRDRNVGSQADFAEHIEDNLAEIVEPDAATMLEIAQTFNAHTTASFGSAQRLATGEVKFRYEETTSATSGTKHEMEVPHGFTVALQPYEGSERYTITARLRYRVREGELSIGYHLDRPEEVLRSAFGDVVDQVALKTGIGVWQGAPIAAIRG